VYRGFGKRIEAWNILGDLIRSGDFGLETALARRRLRRKPRKNPMRITHVFFLAGVLSFFISTAVDGDTDQESPVGLSIDVAMSPANGKHVTVSIRKMTSGNALVLLGLILGNGDFIPSNIHLLVTDAANKSTEFEVAGPPGIAARIFPYVVALPQGAAYQLELDLNDFVNTRQGVRLDALHPGACKISALLRVDRTALGEVKKNPLVSSRALRAWSGEIRSKEIDWQLP
jgi:hypothetical protein